MTTTKERLEAANAELKLMQSDSGYTLYETEIQRDLIAALTRLQDVEAENERLRTAISAIRKSDCGAWLKDCATGLFRCSDGREKRRELSRLLDALYKASTKSKQEGGE